MIIDHITKINPLCSAHVLTQTHVSICVPAPSALTLSWASFPAPTILWESPDESGLSPSSHSPPTGHLPRAPTTFPAVTSTDVLWALLPKLPDSKGYVSFYMCPKHSRQTWSLVDAQKKKEVSRAPVRPPLIHSLCSWYAAVLGSYCLAMEDISHHPLQLIESCPKVCTKKSEKKLEHAISSLRE